MAADDQEVFAARHPGVWGVLSGVLFCLAGVALFEARWWVMMVAILFGVANWLMWRASGPAHEWRRRLLRRFPPRA